MIYEYSDCIHFRKKKSIPTVPGSKYYCSLKGNFIDKDRCYWCDHYTQERP